MEGIISSVNYYFKIACPYCEHGNSFFDGPDLIPREIKCQNERCNKVFERPEFEFTFSNGYSEKEVLKYKIDELQGIISAAYTYLNAGDRGGTLCILGSLFVQDDTQHNDCYDTSKKFLKIDNNDSKKLMKSSRIL